jgi:hypothetical protein
MARHCISVATHIVRSIISKSFIHIIICYIKSSNAAHTISASDAVAALMPAAALV